MDCNKCKWWWVWLFNGKKCCYNPESPNYHDVYSEGCDKKQSIDNEFNMDEKW